MAKGGGGFSGKPKKSDFTTGRAYGQAVSAAARAMNQNESDTTDHGVGMVPPLTLPSLAMGRGPTTLPKEPDDGTR